MTKCPVVGLSALKIGRMIRDRQVSASEMVGAVLERIHRFDEQVNSFIRVVDDQALARAQEADREMLQGRWKGPLHGVPFAAKDIIDVAGLPTTAGSRIWREFVPREDAEVIQRLKRAGAILVGKLNMHEFAFGITSRNPHYGPVRNPWDLSASCGGSSSGSAAALAAGLVPLTLGTDTGGSIRIPASLCGTVGLKPTYGLVSRRGVLPLAWSMDHIGPMALQVEDVALALSAMAGHDPQDPTSVKLTAADYAADLRGDLEGLTIGVPKAFFYENLRQDIHDSVLAALKSMESLGACIQDIEIPGVIEADRAAYTVLFSEAAASLEIHARSRPQDVGREVMANVRLGMTIPATRYIQALRVRTKLRQDLSRVFSQVDVLVVPGTSVDAHPLEGQEVTIAPGITTDVRTALTRYTRFFNLAGNPVLSLPCGLSQRGLPVSLQLVGAPFDEARLLSVGNAYQRAFPMEPLMPDLFM